MLTQPCFRTCTTFFFFTKLESYGHVTLFKSIPFTMPPMLQHNRLLYQKIFLVLENPYWLCTVIQKTEEISRINKILHSFKNTHFLVILTDFRGGGITKFNYPLIIGRLQLVWSWGWLRKKFMYPIGLDYVEDEVLKRNAHSSDYRKRFFRGSPHWTFVAVPKPFHFNISNY